MNMGDCQYVIYENPLDAPNKFVVRRFFFMHGPERVAVGVTDSLEEARALVPKKTHGCQIGRMPQDEPQIVEVWMSKELGAAILKALNEKVI
jgi:hypothetical protein